MSRSLWMLTLVVATMTAVPAQAELEQLFGDWASKLPPTQASPKGSPAATAEINDDTMVLNAAPVNTLTSHEGESVVDTDFTATSRMRSEFSAPPIVSNPYANGSCDGGPSVPCQSCKKRSCGGGCGGGCALVDRCEVRGLSECRPHHAPVLPAPGSFYQYFRSRNSYSDIWAGYADETRDRIRNNSAYLHGPQMGGCGACGELIEPGCQSACDGGCR